MMELFAKIESFCLGLGEDVRLKKLKFYWAFARIKNFAIVDPRTRDGKFLLYCKADFPPEDQRPPTMCDVTSIGHFGTGNMELTVTSTEDLEVAKPFLLESYEIS
jgi:predicted transport protein